ncbi:hypothetical protein ACFQ0T_29970 [Kitasatospora gansuensis]
MGMQHYGPDEDALVAYQQTAAVEHAERTAAAPGVRPAPLRVSVLDTITVLETQLLELADQIAGAVQRPAFTIRSASPLDEVARSVALMGARDAADPRRWRFNMTPNRDGQHAASWLADRLTGPAGPFRALNDTEHAQVSTVARSVRRRFDSALGDAPRRSPTGRECDCGGKYDVVAHAGGADAAVQCDRCGTGFTVASLLDRITAA